MSTQKKRKCLTIEQRAEIVEQLRLGISLTQIATDYNVSVPAVSHIKKNQENILRQKKILEKCGSSTQRKRYTGIEVSPREQMLYTWLSKKRNVGDPVKGSSLAEQALLFNEAFEGDQDFKASAGYLYKFKKRHCIRALSIHGERVSVNNTTSKAFCQQFVQFCQDNGYSLDQVYNADEAGLYWKILPSHKRKNTRSKIAEAIGSEDRVSILVASNADGSHKIPPLLVGKFETPHCFDNIRCLSTEYRYQQDGFLTRDLVLDWFENVFLPAVQQKHGSAGKKVILLLDNAPIHPDPQEFDRISDICTVMPIPSSVTYLIQPMDRGIIERIKKSYKQNLLRFILSAETDQEMIDTHKSINMLQVCNFLAYSWSAVSTESIRLGWKRIFRLETDIPSEPQLSGKDVINMLRALPDCKKLTEKEANSWLNADATDPGWKMLSEEEMIIKTEEGTNAGEIKKDNDGELEDIVIKDEPIMKEVDVKEEKEEEEANEFEDEHETENPPSDREVLQALTTVMAWYQTTPECSRRHINFFEGLRNTLTTRLSAHRQYSKRKK